jgi:uncharacterized protein (DUF1800 family)
MARPAPAVEHLLRRAGFGATPAERTRFARLPYLIAVNSLIGFDPAATDVDDKIGAPGYVGVTSRGAFLPNSNVDHARQRWLFRMVHSPAPLQEKMALFWHHHFATAWDKIRGIINTVDATRLMAAKPPEDPQQQRGQIELFRQFALGNFRQLLIEVARDPAMLYWLDGRLNVRAAPQENFGRELMELFTVGVGFHTEQDVYAAARVFTGWNLRFTGARGTDTARYQFNYNAAQHDVNEKEFSFAIHPDGNRKIPARPAAAGMQDGIDLITALAVHPETARRMARRLWTWFVSETDAPDAAFVEQIASVYLDNDTNMKPVIRAVLLSKAFTDPRRYFQRYSWPVEYVVRSLREVGHVGFSLESALTPLLNMGQQLLEPPDVNGWALGPAWFSTAGMLARMNFASTLATNQKFELRTAAQAHRASPDRLVQFATDSLALPALDPKVYGALVQYVQAGTPWTGSDAQLLTKAAGVFHLLAGAGDYQFV